MSSIASEIKTLEQGGFEAQFNAATALGASKDPTTLSALIAKIGSASSVDASVLTACARSLGKIADPKAIQPLTLAIKKFKITFRRF